MANAQSAKNRNIFLEEVNDLLTSGKPTIDKQGKVTFEFLDPTKKKFKVWPSAYASGWGVRCTKKGGPGKMGKGGKK